MAAWKCDVFRRIWAYFCTSWCKFGAKTCGIKPFNAPAYIFVGDISMLVYQVATFSLNDRFVFLICTGFARLFNLKLEMIWQIVVFI